MDKVDQLIERIEQNFSDYLVHIKGFEKSEIIDMSWRICVMKDVHFYLSDPDNIYDELAEYLLKFKNPLEIVADLFELRSPDFLDLNYDIESICRDKSAEQDGYELAEPVDEQRKAQAAAREEARRLLSELKALGKPNCHNGSHYEIKVSDDYIKLAGSSYKLLLCSVFTPRRPILIDRLGDSKDVTMVVSKHFPDETSIFEDTHIAASKHEQAAETLQAFAYLGMSDELKVKLKKAAEYIVETSARNTTSGTYTISALDIPAEIISPELYAEHISIIADIMVDYDAVVDVEITACDSIVTSIYLDYCPNFESSLGEQDDYPDDREILDPSSIKPKPEKPQAQPATIEKLTLTQQLAAAKKAVAAQDAARNAGDKPHKPKKEARD